MEVRPLYLTKNNTPKHEVELKLNGWNVFVFSVLFENEKFNPNITTTNLIKKLTILIV